MAPTPQPTPSPTEASQGLSTPAIVIIVVGVYMTFLTLVLIIRQCLKSHGLNCCPEWVTEQLCGSCCGAAEGQRCCLCVALVAFAEMCDCSTPSKKSCMDSVCPTKQWCDDHFCCCMNAAPGGNLCEDCQGPECGCGDCNCACNCNVPECNSINCICFEINLSSPSAPPAPR